jgi:hypothetical protein
MAKKQVKKPAAPSRACGYAIIPEGRLDMVTKVVKALQKEGVSFIVEEADDLMFGPVRWRDGTVSCSCVPNTSCSHENKRIPVHLTPGSGTLITWPDPEFQSEAG